jgi:flavin reductase (DIM6/NTAB) family NADH-FMN oxidoreductase RutF
MKSIRTQFGKLQCFYPYTVALVGARVGDRLNFMTCAWHTALSTSPPLFGVLIGRTKLTHGLIAEAREFTVNFLGYERVKLSALMGRRSGAVMDKIKESAVSLLPARFIQTPIIAEAYASMECRLVEVKPFGDHDLFAGEVLAIHEDSGSFDADGLFNAMKTKPLLYLGTDFYITIDPETLKRVVPD